MGNNSSGSGSQDGDGRQPADGDGDGTSSSSGASSPGRVQSATVIIFGLPNAEREGVTTGAPSQEDINAARQARTMRYTLHTRPDGGAYVQATDTNSGAAGDAGTGAGQGQAGPSFGPFGGGGGGGGGGDVRPDEVDDSFQLDSIGGLEDQKEYLQRSIILPFLKKAFFKEWGVSPPKGILLHGPPGTGKTFMAKSIVNELKKELGPNVHFFYRKGGDVFSMWFGESQKKLREVFETANALATSTTPSIIFFDEIDGLCPSRDGSHNHGTEAYSSVVTCFLGQMDSLENGRVFVIAATNRLDAVDPAVRRPGRFDKHLAFGFPDEQARKQIIQIHTNKWSQADKPPEDLVDRLAQQTIGFSGADLEKLCKDVVYTAIEDNKGVLTDDMKITESHWRCAINSMQRTAVNNFGSSLFVPTRPNQIVTNLIQPTVDKVIQKITPQLTAVSLNQDITFPWIHKSFLIHIPLQQSKSFLNNQILQGILTNPLFNKKAIFELSTTAITNKILSGAKPSILAVILDVINQAQDAKQTEDCVVVIVPNINEILELSRGHNIPSKLVVQALAKIQGPKMFLLATSSVPVQEIHQDLRVTELFYDRHYQPENPRVRHLQNFYQFVLASKKLAYPDQAQLLDGVATQAARISDNHNYERILNLASSLAAVDMDDDNDLQQTFTDIFDSYQTSRL